MKDFVNGSHFISVVGLNAKITLAPPVSCAAQALQRLVFIVNIVHSPQHSNVCRLLVCLCIILSEHLRWLTHNFVFSLCPTTDLRLVNG